jgi:hypothetical protein
MKKPLLFLIVAASVLLFHRKTADANCGCGLSLQVTTWQACNGSLVLSVSNAAHGWFSVESGYPYTIGLANGDRVNAEWRGISCPHPTFNFATTQYFWCNTQDAPAPIATLEDSYAQQWMAVVVCPNGYGYLSTIGAATCTP